MNRRSFISALIFAMVISFIGGFFNFPKSIVILLVLIFVVYFFIYPTFQLFFGISDVNKIEELLIKNKKNPLYGFYYGLANGLKTEVDESMHKINQSFNLRVEKKKYQLIHAYFHQRPEEMEKLLNRMGESPFTLYYRAARSILISDFESARTFINRNPKIWMREALTTELLMKENRKDDALIHANNAISKTKGIQRYILIRNWEREYGMSLK